MIAKEDERLKNYNNINTNLEAIVTVLEQNSVKMKKKIKIAKEKLRKINIQVENLRNFIFQSVQDLLNYKAL